MGEKLEPAACLAAGGWYIAGHHKSLAQSVSRRKCPWFQAQWMKWCFVQEKIPSCMCAPPSDINQFSSGASSMILLDYKWNRTKDMKATRWMLGTAFLLLPLVSGLKRRDLPVVYPLFYVCNYHGFQEESNVISDEVSIAMSLEDDPDHYTPGTTYEGYLLPVDYFSIAYFSTSCTLYIKKRKWERLYKILLSPC